MTSAHDLDILQSRLHQAMLKAGMIVPNEKIMLTYGSKSNGVSFTLFVVGRDAGTSPYLPFGTLHFGFTRNECARTLEGVTAGIEAVTQ